MKVIFWTNKSLYFKLSQEHKVTIVNGSVIGVRN